MIKLNKPYKIPEIPTLFLITYFNFFMCRGTNAYILSYAQYLEKYSSLVDKAKTEKRGKIFLIAKNISH